MTRQTPKRVKRETNSNESPAPSAMSTILKAPSPSSMVAPSPSSNLKRKIPYDDFSDARSMARSFNRSYAPSAETFQRREREDDNEPMFLELRPRDHNQRGAQRSSPSSQNADSFVHQSFAHPTFTDIGMKLKMCNDTLGDLQQLGVSHVAALPELVLVGDQSAGKSSLMSGLARVNLPRSAGVCTRCPLHIRLINSNIDRWSCTVSLQQDYDFHPPARGKPKKSDVTNANPFPPWVKRSHRDTKPFKTIFDPSEIEEVLRWAQIAILNHNRSYELFIPGEGSVAKESELDLAARETDSQFSPNIVALEIKGPDLPDLSFYDLPGVFLSPEKEEDEYIVRVVKNLTREYIQREKAIIMWALPMNADSENSISLGIIREAKAVDRTIGVMTKADQLPSQNTAVWLAMFRGEKQSVGHGFFATSRPPDQPLDDAAKWEESFFNQATGNWPEEFGEFRDRCGIEVLLQYLSGQLGHALAQSLPSIKVKVHHRLQEIERDLGNLPELPPNVEHEVKKSLYQFLARMKTAIKDTNFSASWNALNDQFQSCIFKIKPTCQVKEPETQTIDLSDDTEASAITPSRPRPRPSDSTVRATPTPTPGRRQRMEIVTTPVKTEDITMSGIRAPSFTSTPKSSYQTESPFTRFAHLGRLAMNITDIRDEIQHKKRPGMPRDLVPDGVREDMCLNAVQKWEKPLETYIAKTAELVEKVANQALEESLGLLRRRMIFKECHTYLKEFIDGAVARQSGLLVDMFECEKYQVFMLNEDTFNRYKMEEIEHLKRARAIYRLKSVALVGWDYPIRKLEDMSEEEKANERKLLATLLPKIGRDPYETEIEVAGFVRGYYMMAAARFVEGAAMNVNANLFRNISDSALDMYLDDKLHLFRHRDPYVYEHLMEEDDTTAKLRDQLRHEKSKLDQAMKSIDELESSANGAGFGSQTQELVMDSETVMDDTIV
ncbi:P-loop containing nucleoside triphosphate hydrolase protein [Xylariaceae sp. FL0662B]|nr:P-loop containing nucleoside triphosphate hydrolase protein [Xylariaceae sp. FL0662B]